MAQIQEYMPETDAQQPVGGVSPNVELSGSVGRSIERLGGTLEEGGSELYKRQAAQETADVYSAFADQRALYSAKVQQGVQDGSLDVDKLKQDFDDQTSKIGDGISTAQGRNYFERQQSRLRGHILQMATVGQAQVAANDARSKWQSAVGTNSSVLMEHPDQFEDVYHQGLESIDNLVQSGGLPDKMRGKAAEQMGVEFAKGAIRGWMDVDPGKARAMVESGGFDQFLNTDQKKGMLNEIKTSERADTAEDARADMAQKRAQKATEEKWGQDNFAALQNGSLSPKSVIQAVQQGKISPEKGEHYISAIKNEASGEAKTDIRLYNNLADRITNPESQDPIVSRDELLPLAGKGKLAVDGPHSLATLDKLFNRTPEGQAMMQGQKQLFDSAKKTIRFKNDLTNTYDTLGENKLAQFYHDFAQAKANLPAGHKPSELVDSSNPLYFGNRLDSYSTPMQERIQHQFMDRTDKALGLRPTGSDPNPTPNPAARKPGETPAAFLKRTGAM